MIKVEEADHHEEGQEVNHQKGVTAEVHHPVTDHHEETAEVHLHAETKKKTRETEKIQEIVKIHDLHHQEEDLLLPIEEIRK